ncbi:hypothetical protein AN191_11845 [Loktanella sp. 5RATIMAR09]|uniref:hypothetical protein n=1 Tax=Loktanella sp. 5RATIMAR09 TaxID=1225655 RepID=UPI0006EB80D7|nr:hypothetical protein [Loktanella sp. 5RATIMAR09]KQI71672.1 hypothetical protein AN191_11845 [Loktanella sp. 5RATIMAR09]
MEPQLIAIALIVPFVLVFIYAGLHEYRRYKSEGRAKYGLVYDEETGTTHVTGIPEDDEGYDPSDFDPSDFDPSDHNEPDETNTQRDERT